MHAPVSSGSRLAWPTGCAGRSFSPLKQTSRGSACLAAPASLAGSRLSGWPPLRIQTRVWNMEDSLRIVVKDRGRRAVRRPERGIAVNVVIWVVQVLLAAAFLGAGTMKVSQPRQRLATNMGWVEDYSDTGVKTVGALEVLAGLGLIVPAAVHHQRKGERQEIGINALLFILAVVVAWARFGPYSL